MQQKKESKTGILIDTSVLFNDFLHRNKNYGVSKIDKEIANQLFCNNSLTFIRQARYFKTYVADFSLIKFVSLMDKVKVPKAIILKEIESVLSKNAVVPMTATLFTKSTTDFKHDDRIKDIEDVFQFIISKANHCTTILTLNTKDFKFFDANIVHPSKIRSIV